MIIEVSFVLVGGLNLGLEGSWDKVKCIIERYPRAQWKKVIDKKQQKCRYLIKIDE